MELAKYVIDGLTFVGSSSVIDDSIFETLLEQSFNILLNTTSEWNPNELSSAPNASVTKQGFAALLSFILEAAKTDSPTVSTQLEDCQWDEKRNAAFVKSYEANKTKVQAVLSSYGHHPPHIINTKWRQDLVVKDSWMAKVGRLEYLVRLDTECAGESGSVSFNCTPDELQAMVEKLREANKCLIKQAQL